ncbi:MAG: glucose-6-phosphate dehydrogenase [Candidatus Daviesbacteria bacterium]|nr:glucose-6-phosphate dehydrogenase [Candidatus Daviesbacteria bacterium]
MTSFALIIFGITGNLAQKYLIPALYDMETKGLLPNNISIIGNARKPLSREEFEKYFFNTLHTVNRHHVHEIKEEVAKNLLSKIEYLAGDLENPNFYIKLTDLLKTKEINNYIYYLAIYPDLYATVFENLKKQELTNQKNGWARLMIEKPIGHDLSSSKSLNKLLLKYFTEDQIFRLDHYLGKETLHNILTFRFGNGLFEPLMNKEYIDHIQITASEDFGIGKRGQFYDSVGALRDVGQNHQMQMLTFTTMEAPAEFTNAEITRERIKILKNLIPFPKKLVLGQYADYHQEENVETDSIADTFYAFKTEINNDRFKGVPIYIRAGKKLAKTVTEISIIFKNPQNRLFKNLESGNVPNVLTYRLYPNEGIVFKVLIQKPGQEVKLQPEYLQFCYPQVASGHYLPDPYQRLILDVISGDQTFFNDAEEIEAEWALFDPLNKSRKKPYIYKPGNWGPKEADELIAADGRSWLEPSMEFCRI